jgi:predicted Zn-dependent protease
MTVQDEQRLTEEALPKMKEEYPPAKSPELQKYVSALGTKIVKANNLEGNPYHYEFTVVDVVDVNAFAMPAGKIFVTASTHPPSEERVKQINELSANIPARKGSVSTPEFKRAQQVAAGLGKK